MFRSASGDRVDAAQFTRDASIHQLVSRLALRFGKTEGRTRMRVDLQEPPWRVVRAFEQGNDGALVHLHNVSGGILAGDHLSLQIAAGPGSTAQITSTGATRLYRHRKGSPGSQQNTEISLADGALLEYLPDALIPFAGARHSQRTVINLEKNATLFWWEVLAPGRQAMGETFAFESVRIETQIRSAMRPLLLESFLLEPSVRPLSSASRMGDYTHMASFYACQAGLPSNKWHDLEAKLNQFAGAESRPGVTLWGASTLASDGVAIRGLSVSAQTLPASLAGFWRIARLFLTGEEPVAPRKTY
jgi:urease accessory protein